MIFLNKESINNNYPWVLISLCLVLFTTKALFNLPLIIMAILGLRILIKHWDEIRVDHAFRILLLLFLCIWIPIILAMPDMIYPEKSIGTMLRYVAYPFVGVFVIDALRSETTRSCLLTACLAILIFWMLDGLLQFFTGYNLFLFPTRGGDLTGMFHTRRILGLILVLMSPLLLEWVRDKIKVNLWVLALLPVLFLLIMAGGNRSSWISFLIIICVFLFLYRKNIVDALGARLITAAMAFLIISMVSISYIPSIEKKIDRTMGIFSGEFSEIDRASSGRLTIWLVGWDVFKGNMINGVGARGFRYVYKDYADEGNTFISSYDQLGPTHQHLMLLEVAGDTGVIGLIGYLIFFIIAFRYYMSRDEYYKKAMFPWFLSAMVAFLPLNTHMAFYSSYWGSLSWWLLIIAIGMGSNIRSRVADK